MRGAGLLAGLLLLAGGTAAEAQKASPGEPPPVPITQRLGEQVPLDLPFRDEQGKAVKLGDYFHGKPVVLVLAYIRCPKLCSVVLKGVVEGLRGVPFDAGKDFEVVVVSFDPREGPELAAAAKDSYAESYGRPGCERGWHFLTGQEADTRRLADAVGFRYELDKKRGEYRHSAGIMVLTPGGKVARYFFGLIFPARDLRLGLVEASQGAISSPVDNALLLTCLSYDPVTGKYSVAAMKLMRLGGALTVLVLAVYLGWTWRAARRKAGAASPSEPRPSGSGPRPPLADARGSDAEALHGVN
jgi:protein SCO1